MFCSVLNFIIDFTILLVTILLSNSVIKYFKITNGSILCGKNLLPEKLPKFGPP